MTALAVELLALEGWSMACSAAASSAEVQEWIPIAGPMTVAAALRARREWTFATKRNFDAETWWFRARLPAVREGDRLRLDGLATLATVYIDGRLVLESDNMYHAHIFELPVGAVELTIRFAPLAAALAQNRPRPRWKTRLTSHQQLRWIRTSLVGRMPGWSPPVAPVGPWRKVVVERRRGATSESSGVDTERDVSKYSLEQTGERPSVELTRRAPQVTTQIETSRDPRVPAAPPSAGIDLRTRVEGNLGVIELRVARSLLHRPLSLQPPSAESPFAALVVGSARAELAVDGDVFVARIEIANPDLWWPHTHGGQPRYQARIESADGVIDLGPIAFRTIALDSENKRFTISVNGTPVFCRGACWTTLDVVTLTSTPAEYRRVLTTVKDAGMNMLRLTGTLFYEDDAFYDACDELGILVWQDFMFANMDYPIDDAVFRASVEREARELVARLQSHACIALFCGGSEVEQQAAMFGAAREIWRSTLFSDVLPKIVRALRPDVPYWPSSPAGGALPFHVDEGAAHYYGVGAYLRPFEDARRANVKFASECLAFANVPEDDLFLEFLANGEAPVVSAKWKERTSKDNGSGWDFEDVRDHYVGRLFGVDPTRVRYEDMERYLALSRVASGEAMARTLAEFRRTESPTMGALVWFLQDLWPGAGWGLLDSRGEPKSAYWYVKRAMQPLGLFITDEGVNGLQIHIVNDGANELRAELSFALYRDGEKKTNSGARSIVVPARSKRAVRGDELLPTFSDSAHAYRFGPSGHDVAVATLMHGETVLAETSWLVDFAKPPPCFGLEGTVTPTKVIVKTRSFAQAVRIVVPGYVAADNYFDLAPGRERTIPLRRMPSAEPRAFLNGEASALNMARSLVVLQ